jgi:hypothetical protein
MVMVAVMRRQLGLVGGVWFASVEARLAAATVSASGGVKHHYRRAEKWPANSNAR